MLITGLRRLYVAGRSVGRSAGRPAGRLGGARVVSGAETKAFDRGGAVWPPRTNAKDDRSGDPSLDVGLPPPPSPHYSPTTFFEENFR